MGSARAVTCGMLPIRTRALHGRRRVRSRPFRADRAPVPGTTLFVKPGSKPAEFPAVIRDATAQAAATASSTSGATLRARLRDPAWVFYGLAGLLLAAYAVTLFVRPTGQSWSFVDNQLVDAFEVAVALACLARGVTRRPGRAPALVLGIGLLCWAVGDVIWSADPTPSVSIADAFYLVIYPTAYVALMLVVRSYLGGFQASVWLDGAIAGLGTAAVCAAFAFDTILSAVGGSPLSVAVNLAYPIGDLLLLTLAVGALIVVPGSPLRLLVFAAGCGLMAVGDTIYLFQSSAGSYQVGTPLDLTWPLAIFAMSLSVWIPAGDERRSLTVERAPRLIIPAIAAVASVVILMLGNIEHVSAVALGLAAATLVVAAVRLGLALRELRGMTEARRHEAVTDELTGLANRRRMHDELARGFHALRSGDVQYVALLLIDLDHFKEVNDSFGHQTGDALLKQVGPRIRAVIRPTDLVARLGGDEFAVILTGADARFATSVAQRITDALTEPIVVDTASLHIGGSIGVAVAPVHAQTAEELIRCADVAMYRAKGAKSDFDIYEAALDDGADRFRLIEDLRHALDDGSLTLHYQPEIDLRTGEVVTVEALLRWPHPTLGMIPPEHLLNLAEENGMIRPLTDWVFRRALADCAGWWRAGRRVSVAVNLLATDLLDASLPSRVAEFLALAALPPGALVLEITEQMVMADLVRAKRIIGDLAELGVRVSIDDFGTGFSSLAHLSELAVGELKLDRMFTAHLQAGEPGGRDESIARSVIDLGHAVGLRVVAEGIERIEFIGQLVGLGCDLGQGFAIQAPRPAAELDFDAVGEHVRTDTAGAR